MKNQITTKRFVIRKSLIGENAVITFTNNKQVTFTYDHDEIYSMFQEKFESMKCFKNTNLILIVILYQLSLET